MGTREAARAEFERMVQQPEPMLELAHAALLIAAENDPQVDVNAELQCIEGWAAELKSRLDPSWNNLQKLARLRSFLFEELGFAGDGKDYFSPLNSLLHEVIHRRKGIPLTLGIIMMELGWRIGMPFEGVGFPGHFLVRLAGEPGDLLLDPFQHGTSVHEEDCRRMLNEITKGAVEFSPRLIESVDKRQMIVRLLHNLKSSYVRRGEDEGALGAVERLLILEPHDPTQTRDRGLLLYRMQRYSAALESLRTYLDGAGDVPDREDIERTAAAIKLKLSTLN
ncbi:MAG TPA: transglutaminase-like domain-containing protein [Candidatus Udaeobacter sp.]|jgi:regulator of sirC expression with transglutaminase-like and TPR domain|nr:transglutaminase-like domain-containing protein [Candidatus Udaeobacter sp.]